MPVIGPIYADGVTDAPSVGLSLDDPQNAVGSGEGVYASTTGVVQGNAYANLYTFGSQLASLPDSATITAIKVESRVRGTNAAGMGWRNGLCNAGTVLVDDLPQRTALPLVDEVVVWDLTTFPTVAQMKDATFGNRVRAQRSSTQARTFWLDWTRITVTYEVAGTSSVALSGVETDETAGALSTSPGSVPLALAGVATDETTGTLSRSVGPVSRALAGVPTDEMVGTLSPIQAGGGLTVHLGGDFPQDDVPGDDVPYGPPVTDELVGTLGVNQAGSNNIPLSGVPTDEIAGSLGKSLGSVSRALVGVATDEAVGALAVTQVGGPRTVGLSGVATDELAGYLGVLRAPSQTRALAGVATDELAGSLGRTPGPVSRALTGAETDETVGELVASQPDGPQTVALTGLVSDELAGVLGRVVAPVGKTLVGVPTDELVGSLFLGTTTTGRQKSATWNIAAKPAALVFVAGKPVVVWNLVDKAGATATLGGKPEALWEVTEKAGAELALV